MQYYLALYESFVDFISIFPIQSCLRTNKLKRLKELFLVSSVNIDIFITFNVTIINKGSGR